MNVELATEARMRNNLMINNSRWFDTALLVVALIIVWQVGTWIIGADVLPNPMMTVSKLIAILGTDYFRGDLVETGIAFGAGLLISLCGGLALGLALGFNRMSGEVTEPLLIAAYSIPKVTLYPVILLLFGLGINAKIAFAVIHGIIPVTLFTMNAVRNIPRVHIRTARVLGLSPIESALHILIPATLPEIVSGFRFGFALTLLGTLIGEMFASQRGVGYELFRAMESNDVGTVMSLALFLTVLATLASSAFLVVEGRLHSPHARSTKP